MVSNQTPFTIYSVVGPTASGKTERALELAEKLLRDRRWKIEDERDVIGVNLVSVDSRQVYKGLEVTTGADVPVEFRLLKNPNFTYPFFKHQTKPINLHGVSVIDVTDDWSVIHFVQMASQIINWSIKCRWAMILVGGTGLYHRQLRWFLEGKKIVNIPPNKAIRQKAAKLSIKELQDWLKQVDESRLAGMNQSDRNNPRRLVRAIEVGTYKLKKDNNHRHPELVLESYVSNLRDSERFVTNASIFENDNNDFRYKLVWQTIKVFPDDFETLTAKIRKRVIKRLDQGALDEVKKLLTLNLNPQEQVMTTLGVPEMRQFLEGKITQEELINLWSLRELQYAKRQLTWWKKY